MWRLVPPHLFLRWCVLLQPWQKLCNDSFSDMRILDLWLFAVVPIFHEGETDNLPDYWPPYRWGHRAYLCIKHWLLNGSFGHLLLGLWDFVGVSQLQINFHREENKEHSCLRQSSIVLLQLHDYENNYAAMHLVLDLCIPKKCVGWFEQITQNYWSDNVHQL